MTLDEAIKHCRDKAEELKDEAESYDEAKDGRVCLECAKEHEQLAEWLEELQEYRRKYGTGKNAGDL